MTILFASGICIFMSSFFNHFDNRLVYTGSEKATKFLSLLLTYLHGHKCFTSPGGWTKTGGFVNDNVTSAVINWWEGDNIHEKIMRKFSAQNLVWLDPNTTYIFFGVMYVCYY